MKSKHVDWTALSKKMVHVQAKSCMSVSVSSGEDLWGFCAWWSPFSE